MLPRITAALTEFISPVASSRTTKEKPREEPKGFKRQGGKDLPQLKLVPKNQPPSESKAKIDTKTPVAQGVAQAFVQLFSLFQSSRESLTQLFGTRAYQRTLREQRKGRARKGAMLDEYKG